MQAPVFVSRALYSLPQLIPFLLGPLFFGVDFALLDDQQLLASYTLFLAVFLAWYGVKRCAFAIIDRKAARKAEPSATDKLLLLGLIASALVTMALLGLLRLKFEYTVFTFVLALLGFSGLRESLPKKGYVQLAQLFSLLYLTGVGAISLMLMLEAPIWQPLYVALGVACSVLAAEILLEVSADGELYPFEKSESPGAKSKAEKALRAVPFLLVCAPTFIAALSYINELPRLYLAVFIVLIPSAKIITRLKNTQNSSQLEPALGKLASGISVLFIAIIALVSHWSI